VQEYDPYGATTYYSGGVGYGRSQVGNPFGWKAVRVDAETGLLYMRNRYYHVGWGRFLSIDPLGVWGDRQGQGSAYGYGTASPLTQGDPMGLQVIKQSYEIWKDGVTFRPKFENGKQKHSGFSATFMLKGGKGYVSLRMAESMISPSWRLPRRRGL
jgi:RHS repeat-associated protein